MNEPDHRWPLPWDEAERLGLDVLGTCDWGDCDREAWGARWSRELAAWLTVCSSCRRRGKPQRPAHVEAMRRWRCPSENS